MRGIFVGLITASRKNHEGIIFTFPYSPQSANTILDQTIDVLNFCYRIYTGINTKSIGKIKNLLDSLKSEYPKYIGYHPKFSCIS